VEPPGNLSTQSGGSWSKIAFVQERLEPCGHEPDSRDQETAGGTKESIIVCKKDQSMHKGAHGIVKGKVEEDLRKNAIGIKDFRTG